MIRVFEKGDATELTIKGGGEARFSTLRKEGHLVPTTSATLGSKAILSLKSDSPR